MILSNQIGAYIFKNTLKELESFFYSLEFAARQNEWEVSTEFLSKLKLKIRKIENLDNRTFKDRIRLSFDEEALISTFKGLDEFFNEFLND